MQKNCQNFTYPTKNAQVKFTGKQIYQERIKVKEISHHWSIMHIS